MAGAAGGVDGLRVSASVLGGVDRSSLTCVTSASTAAAAVAGASFGEADSFLARISKLRALELDLLTGALREADAQVAAGWAWLYWHRLSQIHAHFNLLQLRYSIAPRFFFARVSY